MLCLVTQSYTTLCDPMDFSLPGSSVLRDSPGKNTEMGCHALLQGIFPTQGLKPGLLPCKWILYRLSHQGSLKILEWVAYPFSRGTFEPQNRTGVSYTAADFLPAELPGKPCKCLLVGLVMSDSCDPMDRSLPGSSVHGILQARILEWVALSFSRGSS